MSETSRSLLVLLAAITAVRTVVLWVNGTDLFFDESQYWSWSQSPAFGYYSKPPLIGWIIAGSTAVCGDSEFCVRIPAVAIHAVTAGLIYFLGRALYSKRTGFWSAIVYATLPGVSVSNGIISTDVPLLFAWALALVGFVSLVGLTPVEEATATRMPWLGAVIMLGLAIGIGLNGKYAMAYFVLCGAVYFWIEPESRGVLRGSGLWIALALGIGLIVPNLLWNAEHQFATFSHTADNAKWEGSLFNPGKGIEFLAAQFGVFGPILMGTLVALIWRVWRRADQIDARDRLLLSFSIPVIAIVSVQAFISRAHPNWAAIAYVPAVVLVTDYMLRRSDELWRNRSLWLNGVLAVLIAAGTAFAGQFRLPGIGDPLARTLGNRELAAATQSVLAAAAAAGRPFAGILTDDRELTASLLYYARTEPTPVYAWRAGAKPRDHFELMQPFLSGQAEPVLLVSRKKDPVGVTAAFQSAEALAPLPVRAGRYTERTLYFFSLAGYRKP